MDELDELSELSARPLATLAVFTSSELGQLADDYGIITVGDLLGSTRGLRAAAVFDAIHEGRAKLERLVNLLPAEVIAYYRQPPAAHPVGGCLLDEGRPPVVAEGDDAKPKS